MDVGQEVLPFAVKDSKGILFTEKDLLGHATLLYFYPKDLTSGCTKQACAFRDHMDAFRSAGIRVIGINPAATHEAFIEKHALNFSILCDVDKQLCTLFDVWKEKSLYGRKYMGVERATFLIDNQGRVAWIERKVSISGHCDRILQAIGEIQ